MKTNKKTMNGVIQLIVFIVTLCCTSVAMADGTGGIIIVYFYIFIVMPILVFIPVIVIALTKQKGVTSKGIWVATSALIGGCLVIFTYWGFDNWISYFSKIPLLDIVLMQSLPAYLILPLYFYFNRRLNKNAT